MAQFNYLAVNKKGERVKGVVDAPTESEVRIYLRSQSLRPLKINKTEILNLDLGKLFGAGSRTNNKDLIFFKRQLSVLLNAGVPLMQGLEIIGGQMNSKPSIQKVVFFIKEKVSGGTFLWEAMAQNKRTFSSIYINMIRAGEASGSLDVILKRLVKYIEDLEKLKKLVITAMIYPIIVTSVSIGVMILMLYFVIPKFELLFKGAGKKLPDITQFVLDLSRFVQTNILIIMGSIFGIIFFGIRYIRTQEGKRFFDFNVLKVPKLGDVFIKIAVARFARTMQTLLKSGITLLDALDICKSAIGNVVIEESVGKMRNEISQGKTLSAMMTKAKYFPPMAVQMVSVGESTGQVDDMLEKVADWYEDEVQMAIQNLSKAIEPIILVVLGGIVAVLLISMYLPIIQMAGSLGK